mmetsp:Transcript_61673/g.121362  ORF Transcript_61673/g.121362 Transcript_61673/m.121362 type:complete len:258 (+) Transcript_61673:439-1212(+)
MRLALSRRELKLVVFEGAEAAQSGLAPVVDGDLPLQRLEVGGRVGDEGAAEYPIERDAHRLNVGRPEGFALAVVRRGRQAMHHEAIMAAYQRWAHEAMLEVQHEQQPGAVPEAGDKLVHELGGPAKLAGVAGDPHEEHQAAGPSVDGLEAVDAPRVPLAHGRLGRVVMPEGVQGPPKGDHPAAARHRQASRCAVEEALEVRAQEVQQALHLGANPVEGQGLRAAAHLLEGELRAAITAQRHQADTILHLVAPIRPFR